MHFLKKILAAIGITAKKRRRHRTSRRKHRGTRKMRGG